MPQIDSLAYSNGLTSFNPWFKASIGLIMLVLALAIDSLVFHLAMILAFILVLIFIAKIDARVLFRLYRLPLVFLAMSLLAMVLSFSPDHIDYLFFSRPFYLGLNAQALDVAKKTFFRSMAGISATYFIALTLPINQLIYLLKKTHVPDSFIEQMVLIYRFIAIFFQEFHTLERALILKGGYKNKAMMIKTSSILASSLFESMMDSMDRYKVALECKLFQGKFNL